MMKVTCTCLMARLDVIIGGVEHPLAAGMRFGFVWHGVDRLGLAKLLHDITPNADEE